MEMTSIWNTLRLTVEELVALRRQGFVSRERRRGQSYFKLRFRLPSGQQCVRYLGSDPIIAAQVEQELARLQSARRVERTLVKLTQHVGEKLRSGKERLAPHLDQAGFHFHGLSIRRKQARA